MKKFITFILCTTVWASISFSQNYNLDDPRLRETYPAIKYQHTVQDLSVYQSPKRPGHYTTADWSALIDSLWGPGLSTEEKLTVFDTYWNTIDQTWGGFPNLVVNWDSLYNTYRPLVEAGVSRGRFYGILCRLTRALNEWHVYAGDFGIDSAMGLNWSEYPNFSSFHYQPGIPIVTMNNPVFRTCFGAGLTPLPDSTAMVYSVLPGHPLDLQPGDIILGYDGIPWKELIPGIIRSRITNVRSK